MYHDEVSIYEGTAENILSTVQYFPYFVLNNELTSAEKSDYQTELNEICKYYNAYKKGARFFTSGHNGDYIPSGIRFKLTRNLIDKESRFMFSQPIEVNISVQDETNSELEDSLQKIIGKILEVNNMTKKLLQGSKDCLIGKRIAILVDFSEKKGVEIHFYNSMQFYYETEYDTEEITKFISFKTVKKSMSSETRRILVNRYAKNENGEVFLSATLYNGAGEVITELIEERKTDLKNIPVVVIRNEGTLEDEEGISEVADLMDYEKGYSKYSNADLDSVNKNMNPILYTVGMNPKSTENLPTGAGAYWDLHVEQSEEVNAPGVGILSPPMTHSEPLKTSLNRIKTEMYNEVDVPDITSETLSGVITSGKALKALYYPLTVRSNEKMVTWVPKLEELFSYAIELVLLNKNLSLSLYTVPELKDVQYTIKVTNNYALLDDEVEEKQIDIQEVNSDLRSSKSYMEKWRRTEDLVTDEKVEEELLQVATEKNMFDTLGVSNIVKKREEDEGLNQDIDENIEDIKENVKM